MILFIHGFASCGLGDKSRLLIEHFGRDALLTPDLPHEPVAAVDALEAICATQPVDLLVGSSMGGFYATCLNRRQTRPAVLINPVVRPADLFAACTGPHRRWCDDQVFDLTDAHVAQMRELERDRLRPDERYLVLLQSGDEVLNYRLAADYYRDFDVDITFGGNHRFVNLRDYLPKIEAFAGQVAAGTQQAER